MQDAELLVYQALAKDAALLVLMGGRKQVKTQNWARIYRSRLAPYAEEDTRITLYEVLNTDEVPGDNRFFASEVNIRIDLWTMNEDILFPIVKRIKEVLQNSFHACVVRLEAKNYEEDTKIHHKPINVYLLIEQGV